MQYLIITRFVIFSALLEFFHRLKICRSIALAMLLVCIMCAGCFVFFAMQQIGSVNYQCLLSISGTLFDPRLTLIVLQVFILRENPPPSTPLCCNFSDGCSLLKQQLHLLMDSCYLVCLSTFTSAM